MVDRIDKVNEIFMVPVPRKHLDLVYQTLASAMATANSSISQKEVFDMNATAPTRSGTLHLQDRDAIDWNKSNLTVLRNGLRCVAPLKMLELTATKPGHPVYFEEVSKQLGQPEKTTRAQIGTLTKVIKREFNVDYNGAIWPVKVDWDKDNHRMYYTMDEQTAQAWRDGAK